MRLGSFDILYIWRVFIAGIIISYIISRETWLISFHWCWFKLAVISWWTLLVKIIDLVETFVFVLRKKDRQISFLHVYHHVTTVLLLWIAVKYFPGGMTVIPIVVNSMVHVIMYTYYLLSSGGPLMQKFISPIKSYITVIQMVRMRQTPICLRLLSWNGQLININQV